MSEHSDDPTRLFRLLARELPVAEADLERLSASIDSALDALPPRGADGWQRRLLPLAASLLLAGLIGGYLWTHRGTESLTPTLAERSITPPAVAAEWTTTSPGTAQVLDLVVGDTQVVMIFDEGLDL